MFFYDYYAEGAICQAPSIIRAERKKVAKHERS
jgi:hypothetical protein